MKVETQPQTGITISLSTLWPLLAGATLGFISWLAASLYKVAVQDQLQELRDDVDKINLYLDEIKKLIAARGPIFDKILVQIDELQNRQRESEDLYRKLIGEISEIRREAALKIELLEKQMQISLDIREKLK